MGILNRLLYWRRRKADLTAISVGDIPERLPKRHGVITGTAEYPKWIVFDCPCERGHRVMLNLDPAHRPQWRIDQAYPLTLSPSVDERSLVGHCHYVVRKGRVTWIERTDNR